MPWLPSIGSSDGRYACRWREYELLANREYDSSYGTREVPADLVVVGEEWWLERVEYDGSEGWEHKSQPVRGMDPKTIERIIPGRELGLFPDDGLASIHRETNDVG